MDLLRKLCEFKWESKIQVTGFKFKACNLSPHPSSFINLPCSNPICSPT
ncbi:protein of unknown function [Xenorhabdus nematophila AN6/1]|nr:hypothetical protein XNA1_4530017 [Xenorhabdus nematophila str. Anatoliense]CEE95768.1 hypothetical protein XNA1_650017 [Xenorhabdus nematophila str. Anatoliense]CEK22574.1 protein of unknown function [Xenorhabdus nematophila AN6/1]